MFPHEKALVERYSNRPFAIIGINSDPDRSEVRVKNRENGVNWRSFWNGPKGPSGPISTEWNVRAWPTLYAIDHDGIIRHRWQGGPDEGELDRIIESLVAEAERAGDR